MIAFDKYMNLVLADTQEIRKPTATATTTIQSTSVPQNKIVMERRTLGLLILRGDIIISMSVEAPPPTAGAVLEKVILILLLYS
jgi:small nuclear ribonucleoprotein B and B'